MTVSICFDFGPKKENRKNEEESYFNPSLDEFPATCGIHLLT